MFLFCPLAPSSFCGFPRVLWLKSSCKEHVAHDTTQFAMPGTGPRVWINCMTRCVAPSCTGSTEPLPLMVLQRQKLRGQTESRFLPVPTTRTRNSKTPPSLEPIVQPHSALVQNLYKFLSLLSSCRPAISFFAIALRPHDCLHGHSVVDRSVKTSGSHSVAWRWDLPYSCQILPRYSLNQCSFLLPHLGFVAVRFAECVT